MALYYARPGVHLFISGRHEERLADVARKCTDRGASVHTRVIDVRDRDAMHDWITECHRRENLDLVVANAGISGGTVGGAEPGRQVREIFDVNLTGVLNTIEPAIALMTPRGCGQIAIMSSLASFGAWRGAPAYGASKGAVRLYGEALRGALAGSGIGISVICPGFVESRMTAVNPFPMPFMMTSSRAAQIIAKGLRNDRIRIAFPWQTYAISGFLGLLPPAILLILIRNLPGKAPLKPD